MSVTLYRRELIEISVAKKLIATTSTLELEGKTIILVDDGIATGSTSSRSAGLTRTRSVRRGQTRGGR